MVPAIDWTLPVGPLVGRTAAWAEEVRAPRPAPPAISAETSSAIPRAGRSRRFEDGYDILLSSRERGDGGEENRWTAGLLRGCAALAGIWLQKEWPWAPGRALGLGWSPRCAHGSPAVP